MTTSLEYMGCTGSVEFSAEDGVFHGRLLAIRDLVTYEADDRHGLTAAFREAVDDYLALVGEDTQRPHDGATSNDAADTS
ncbi:hypothetical protein [Caenispirillum bisanense]|uniref:HicB family protein n=1 Tax=Caenispirillum bisanense TaxID=414052 RepID=A0A286GWU2_9PROT|nr:hypothetical protein [Caenispirillum bisanense]SOD99952.1 hypothetical protein SAMN05421508_110138 [Caenispirillum bisanense]